MKFLNFSQKQRFFIYVVILILVTGIAIRAYGISLRVLFLDEAVHYDFVYDLWSAQKFHYTSIFAPSLISTINASMNIYYYFTSAISQHVEPWQYHIYEYANYIQIPAFLKAIDNLMQPYFYFKHIYGNVAYKYDPVYHGPFLYYIGDLVFNMANNHNIFLLRLPMVIASILSLFWIFLYKEYLGKAGILISLVLVAFSPGLVYFSNLGNYENYFASFSLLSVGVLLLGVRYRNPWILSLSGFLLLALITIKETALVVWFCIVLSTFLTYFVLYVKNRPSKLIEKLENVTLDVFRGKYNKVIIPYLLPAALSFIAGGAFFAMLYSSFSANPQGIHDGLTSWMYWKNTGSQGGHVKPPGYYTRLILEFDFPLAFLFATGVLMTIFTQKDKYKLFISFWALTTWIVYSFIPYKTPWLILNFLLPFAVVAGIGWNIIIGMLDRKEFKYAIAVIITVFALNSATIGIITKWENFDKESNNLSYVHTYREFEEEMKALYSLILASDKGEQTEVTVAAPEYWPMPAYVVKYYSFGYFGGVRGRDINANAPIIVNDAGDDPELKEYLLEEDIRDYVKLRTFRVRPGVSHTIFVKEKLLKRYLDLGYQKYFIQPGRNFLFKERTGESLF